MKTVVITGSTRGIGFGLAEEFLKRGHQVVISGRSSVTVAQAVAKLAARYDIGHILAQPCEVSDYEQVQTLWDVSTARFGRVDIWINNAALSNPRKPLHQQDVERLEAVVRANLLGVMYASRVAIGGMLQQGGGQLFNMEGLGSSGPVTPGLVPYGATKSGLTYLTNGLIKELAGTAVKVGFLSPGMVVTDLLTEGYSQEELARARRIFNILADRVETVAPFLVERVLANPKHGARITWLTTPKIAWRFATSAITRRDVMGT
jgi:NAD(P)-dependent dehydrogenase (short-subunit alcohol dehydrogenase family)